MNSWMVITTVYFLLANSSYVLILLFGYLNARRLYLESQLNLSARLAPLRSLIPISILMPAYNEEKSIIESVQSMLNLDYPDFEIIVCNDGSKDNTLTRLQEFFHLERTDLQPPQALPSGTVRSVWIAPGVSNLLVIDKENGGKADALNAAINYSRHPLVCCVDSDSILDAQGLARVAMPFFEEPDTTIATGGTISLIDTYSASLPEAEPLHSLHRPKPKQAIAWRWLDIIQAIEYLRAFLVGRMGWDYIQCTMIISGAFGLFKKSMVIKVGGYTRGSIGEDMELLLRMHSYSRQHGEAYRVCFLPDPVCYTEAPSDFKTLGRQRARWQHGLLDSLWRTRDIFFAKHSGRVGWVALPYLLVFEAISAPLELLSYLLIAYAIATGSSSPDDIALLFAVIIVYGAVLNLGALIIDHFTFQRYRHPKDIFKLVVAALLEQFGFRQLHLYWRIKGIYSWLRGRHQWGEMKRRGLGGKDKKLHT